MNRIYFVVPCFNETAVLPMTAERLGHKVQALISASVIAPDSRIVFIDDGSRDETWTIIRELASRDSLFGGIRLSRNRGHQNALLAGLLSVKDLADAVISMDADLQDDIDVTGEFIKAFEDGNDIVYGVRKRRDTDTLFKRSTAMCFYQIMKRLGVDSVYNHADYRLMSRRALDALAEFHEVNLFLRGLVPLIGFRSTTVAYDRHERAAGESKYPFRKMLAFAIDGITSFSVKPLRMITTLGLLIFAGSFIVLLYAFISKLSGSAVQGWTAIIASIWALGGLQLLGIGICGEYIGKIYNETKARPRFIIEEKIL